MNKGGALGRDALRGGCEYAGVSCFVFSVRERFPIVSNALGIVYNIKSEPELLMSYSNSFVKQLALI
ncbi:hypothetical protein QA584_03860 [Anaerocolumna sp. AGMB13025]|uniref:hypothetical protein n=1 Tax=Anaerocolumna sp. AGMB13025 TaxID=3039116 RepID=UPI00241FDEAA|nr:hypothetical protein [Anaerocolumna sp. AGMB13025]WFR58212.1 hypothetical protein QA584_03860 [Anaerocolumna sp. AGMB13025]